MKQRINKGEYIKTFDGKLYKVKENTHAEAEYVHAEVDSDSKYDGKAIPMNQVYIVNIPEEQKDSDALLHCGILMDTVNAQKAAYLESQIKSQEFEMEQTRHALRRAKEDVERLERSLEDDKDIHDVAVQSYESFAESIKQQRSDIERKLQQMTDENIRLTVTDKHGRKFEVLDVSEYPSVLDVVPKEYDGVKHLAVSVEDVAWLHFERKH